MYGLKCSFYSNPKPNFSHVSLERKLDRDFEISKRNCIDKTLETKMKLYVGVVLENVTTNSCLQKTTNVSAQIVLHIAEQ